MLIVRQYMHLRVKHCMAAPKNIVIEKYECLEGRSNIPQTIISIAVKAQVHDI